MSPVYIFLTFVVAMVVVSALAIVLLGYLLGMYDKYRARKHPDAQPKDTPLPSP